MFTFLLKGMMRDKSHSLFPILTVAVGVCVTVLLITWMNGILGDMISNTAKFETGHLKIVTQEYKENIDVIPLEFSLVNSDMIKNNLEENYPSYTWNERINFGGIIDVPDENGETREQGFFFGKGFDLLSKDSQEVKNLGLQESLTSGRLPAKIDEVLLSSGLMENLNLKIKDSFTLISTTMDGGMAMMNFTVCGTVIFGIQAVDKNALIVDIEGARKLLDMDNSCNEIVGLEKNLVYNKNETQLMLAEYNNKNFDKKDKFSPTMISIRDQQGLATYLDMVEQWQGAFIFIFVFIMSIVLWNSGLMKGIRRYGEIGVRLAIGESKGHIYRSMIIESMMTGLAGTILGTLVGLFFSWILQHYGVSMGSLAQNSTILIPNTIYARITPQAFYIGFIPGLLASMAGAILAGRGIFVRETAQLFKELEQ